MEKKSNKGYIIVILILSVLLVAVSGYLVYDKFLSKEYVKEENAQNNHKDDNNENVVDNNYIGTYVFKYNDKATEDIKANEESLLILKNDNTFYLEWNACAGMIGTTGNYNINNNKIILSNLKSNYQDILDTNLQGRKTLEFVIVSEDEIYLDMDEDSMACTMVGNKYGTFVKAEMGSGENSDMNTYVGEWYESTEHASDSNPDSLKIKINNNKLFVEELYFSRIANFENFDISVNNGLGTFEAITDNGVSSDGKQAKITGTLVFGNNTIRVLVEKSNVEELEPNMMYTFTYKK